MGDWLVTALRDHESGQYPWRDDDPESGDVTEGDILVVSDMDQKAPNRMVVVLDVLPEHRCFFAAFVTNERSAATSEDVYLPPAQTGLPYRIAGLAGLTGWLWYVQVERRVGALTDEAFEAMSAGHCGIENELQRSLRGIPLQDRSSDLRWPWLEAEADSVRAISRDCDQKHDNDDLALPFVDPRLVATFDSRPHESEAQLLGLLETATRTGRTRGIAPSCVERMINDVDPKLLRAYPSLFSSNLAPTSTAGVAQGEDRVERLLSLTKADGLSHAPFVRIIGRETPHLARSVEDDGRRAEVLFESWTSLRGAV